MFYETCLCRYALSALLFLLYHNQFVVLATIPNIITNTTAKPINGETIRAATTIGTTNTNVKIIAEISSITLIRISLSILAI